MGLKLIITGTTGMVGEGVLLHCLADPRVEKVLSLTRRSAGVSHPKLTELVVPDFLKLEGVEAQLAGHDACFWCAGISSVGLSEADYTRTTYDTPVQVATVLARLNPGMVLVHVSGQGTDGSEQGRVMWARVKGRAENALTRLPFKAVYNMRPALMKPVAGQQRVKGVLKPVLWLYPVLKAVAPGMAMTLDEVGDAMLRCVVVGAPRPVLEVVDMQALARGQA